jgi:hypothetical protein
MYEKRRGTGFLSDSSARLGRLLAQGQGGKKKEVGLDHPKGELVVD